MYLTKPVRNSETQPDPVTPIGRSAGPAPVSPVRSGRLADHGPGQPGPVRPVSRPAGPGQPGPASPVSRSAGPGQPGPVRPATCTAFALALCPGRAWSICAASCCATWTSRPTCPIGSGVSYGHGAPCDWRSMATCLL